jgi:hypothetical protein
MGFKADTSFLRFLTMGARGVQQTIRQLEGLGFQPIELERYCASNKIWATKVKRLRLPDLLCVKTGLRLEVRAKSDLKIRMSDAPNNPDRVWDAGLQDNDLAAFIACFDNGNGFTPADEAMYFKIEDLRNTVEHSKLGPPKSASEGAESDRTWPACIPKRDGKVIEVTDQKIVTEMFETAEQAKRKQTYTLKGKTPYVNEGDTFTANVGFISGMPSSMANLSVYSSIVYDPFTGLLSANDVDRYAAAKSFPYRDDNRDRAITALETLIAGEGEARIKLEAAGSASALGSAMGQDIISHFIWDDDANHELSMEAVLILTELGDGGFTHDLLTSIAGHARFAENEIRQAAIWGLGKAGLKSYAGLLPYIADAEENMALHAIAGFDEHTPQNVIDDLVALLISGDTRKSPAASEALRIISTPEVLNSLMQAYDQNADKRNWILATLGRMSPELVRGSLQGHEAFVMLEPMLLCASGTHWLASEQMNTDISFLLKQNI